MEDIPSLVASLPKHEEIPGFDLSWYNGSWRLTKLLPSIIRADRNFEPRNTDIMLASKPKSGTTWLKALVYSIINRTKFTNSNHPLLTSNPHELVPFITKFYSNENQDPDLSCISSPRIFATHAAYEALSMSLKESKCKVVYIARNPFDTLVSGWYYFSNKDIWEGSKKFSFENYFELCCKGMEIAGPHWDHVLGYWKQSLERPNKVLFLKYEDLIEDGIMVLKKIAMFLECEFTLEEEKHGVIDEILKLCSFKYLKEMEVNKDKKCKYDNITSRNTRDYFRKGEIGDWVNHLSPFMFERLDQVMKEKFDGSGLEFKILPSK